MPADIEKAYDLPYPPATVYRAWVSSDTVIPPATRTDILPEIGGHYRLIMETPDFTGVNEGKFSLVEPESRVVYSWEWNGDDEVSTVDVRFEATDAGTRVELAHTGFTRTESVANHDSGWDSYMEGLLVHLGGP